MNKTDSPGFVNRPWGVALANWHRGLFQTDRPKGKNDDVYPVLQTFPTPNFCSGKLLSRDAALKSYPCLRWWGSRLAHRWWQLCPQEREILEMTKLMKMLLGFAHDRAVYYPQINSNMSAWGTVEKLWREPLMYRLFWLLSQPFGGW